MQLVFDKLFGASWGPSLLGYILAILAELDVYLSNDGLPTDLQGWVKAIAGIGFGVLGRVTKQSNVTNAKEPNAVAQPAPAAPVP